MNTRSKSISTLQRPATAVQNSHLRKNQNKHSIQTGHRKALNNLIPDLPSFSNKNNNSTALLYSKFIMKGINTNKVDLVKQSFNMKKQTLQYEKKNSLNFMKTLKSTVNSTKKELIHHQIQNSNQQKTKNNEFYHFDDDSENKLTTPETKSFIRVMSARKQTLMNQRQDGNHLKIQSQKILKRPKTAVATSQSFVRTLRARTAKQKKAQSDCNPFTLDFDNSKQFETERKISSLMKIQQQGFFVNHIQRNKRLLSANSNKNSVYLTGIDTIQNENDDPKKVLFQKLNKKLKLHQDKEPLIEDINEDEVQNQRKGNGLTQSEIRQINEKNKINARFMKEHMPQQYKKYIVYLQMKQNNLTEKDRALLSINLDHNSSQFEQSNSRLNRDSQQCLEEAKQYYQECANVCDDGLHFVNLYKLRNKKEKIVEEILNVEACQQLLKLQQQRYAILSTSTENNNNTQQQIKRITQIQQNMYQLVKQLHFFKQKPQSICKMIFNLDFSISTVQEQQTIVSKNQEINFMYVILHGSVVKITTNYKIKQIYDDDKKMGVQSQQFENTLFDGQSFGQPDNKNDEKYNYEVISSQKVLLMKFCYLDFCKIYKENSNLQERIELLSKIFGNVPGCRPLTKEKLQDLALEMQSLKYQAKQVIFRKGDHCQKLIIVSSGKVFVINQHILKRQKKNSKDMKKRSKSETKVNMKDFSIQNLRRKNLRNYEIIHENQEQLVFYYQDVMKQLGYGDVINWQGFYDRELQNISVQDKFVDNTQKNVFFRNSEIPFRINCSLISKADNTQIYLIDMKKLRKLPDYLKHVIDTKVNLALSQIKKESQTQKENKKYTSIKKWDQFKQKICNQIVNQKLKV